MGSDSAKRQERRSLRKRKRNITVRTALKSWSRKVQDAVQTGKAEEARKILDLAVRAYAKAAQKGVVPRNTASRKISRLTLKVQKGAASPKAA
jgi:small subunit ribosomal protein S20